MRDGAFFIAVGIFQAGWAMQVITRRTRLVLALGALVILATIGAWVVTRTVGSLVGPSAHQTEMIGFGDVLSTVFEGLIVAGCLLLLRRSWAQQSIDPGWVETAVAVVAIALTMITVLGLYSSVGGA